MADKSKSNVKKGNKKKVNVSTSKTNKVGIVKKVEEVKREKALKPKKSFKDFLKNNKGLLIVLGIVALLVLMTILVEGNDEPKTEIDYSTLGSDVSSWYSDTQSDKYVITVIALSYCHYCADYKPKITEIANRNNVSLYWFEIDTMSEEDAQALQSTYKLEQYTGSSPYTAIIKGGEFVTDTVGYMPEEDTITFLTGAGMDIN